MVSSAVKTLKLAEKKLYLTISSKISIFNFSKLFSSVKFWFSFLSFITSLWLAAFGPESIHTEKKVDDHLCFLVTVQQR